MCAGKSVLSQDKALKFNLNEDGSQYVKAIFFNQVWVRYNQNNPGTTINGHPESATFDIGLRRTRFQFYGQLSEHIFFYTHFGTNNLHYNATRKQGLFFHDAFAQLKVAGDYLYIGAGLSGWNGLSRYASPSTGTLFGLDAPLYQQVTIDVNDQFFRKFSVHAKGRLGKIDYRFALTKPMSIDRSIEQSTSISSNALFSAKPPEPQLQGYVKYQFLEKESNDTPYSVGTYLGKKNVFNIGAGFIYQQNAMWHTENNGIDTVYSDLGLFAVDIFYDHKLNAEKENAITAYASFNVHDYGKKYVRNVGVMNPANGTNENGTFNGAGNAFPMMGTGTTIYVQPGYLFKKGLLGKMGTLQPYVAVQYSQFDLLKDPMLMYEGGFNWLIKGHGTKISFNYQNRPVFEQNNSGDWIVTKRRGMFVTQFQIMI